ncbi:MAG: IS1634 family transposase, partial [Candidatus Humimicrobiaceae bacterium]
VNGKPRPIVLAYLGKAEGLLKRLQGIAGAVKLKSYSHGLVAALLDISSKLNIAEIINKYTCSKRLYTSEKPLRNNLTAGITLLLAAIGRIAMPTSKRGWAVWAKTTSLGYLLRRNLSKIDSQHFWDLMDAIPEEVICKIEASILEEVFKIYNIETDSLFFDTTNFFTYIDSTNLRSKIAMRGKNKQKRNDLRQVGLALVVTKDDMIPLFHLTYEGNLNDSTVFKKVISQIVKRMDELNFDLKKHTIVFDRGNNSKPNLKILESLELFYVGALTPYHHRELIEDACGNFEDINIGEAVIKAYRQKKLIWEKDRTVVVFVSDKLKAGRIRGIYQSLSKAEKKLKELQSSLVILGTKKRKKDKLEEKIAAILKGQYIKHIIDFSLAETDKERFVLDFFINYEKLKKIEEDLGFRIIMTNRHDWDTASIIKAYHGQSKVENAFKNLKNPYHLSIKPQFHWTDQKIRVHFFICVLGYLLAAIVWRKARLGAQFSGTLDNLLDTLGNIRLAALLEENKNRGAVKAIYKLEEVSDIENRLMQALEIEDLHNNRPKIGGVSVYK